MTLMTLMNDILIGINENTDAPHLSKNVESMIKTLGLCHFGVPLSKHLCVQKANKLY